MEAYLSKGRQQNDRSWENMKIIFYAGQIPAANGFLCPTQIPIVAANQAAYLHSYPFKIQFVKQKDGFLWYCKLLIYIRNCGDSSPAKLNFNCKKFM